MVSWQRNIDAHGGPHGAYSIRADTAVTSAGGLRRAKRAAKINALGGALEESGPHSVGTNYEKINRES